MPGKSRVYGVSPPSGGGGASTITSGAGGGTTGFTSRSVIISNADGNLDTDNPGLVYDSTFNHLYINSTGYSQVTTARGLSGLGTSAAGPAQYELIQISNDGSHPEYHFLKARGTGPAAEANVIVGDQTLELSGRAWLEADWRTGPSYHTRIDSIDTTFQQVYGSHRFRIVSSASLVSTVTVTSTVLVVNSSRHVGINTTNPSAYLAVRQTTATIPILSLESTAGTQLLFFSSVGHLGLGTTIPASRLQIQATTAPVTVGGEDITHLYLSPTPSIIASTLFVSAIRLAGGALSAGGLTTINDVQGLFLGAPTAGVNVTITRAQDILLTPGAGGSTVVRGLVIRRSTAAQADLLVLESTVPGTMTAFDSSGRLGIGLTPTADLDVAGGVKFVSSAVVINTSGEIGLGTTSPRTRLEINNSTAPTTIAGNESITALYLPNTVSTISILSTLAVSQLLLTGPIAASTAAMTVTNYQTAKITGPTSGANVTYTNRQAVLIDVGSGSTANRALTITASTLGIQPLRIQTTASALMLALSSFGQLLGSSGTTINSAFDLTGVGSGMRQDGTSARCVLQALGKPLLTWESSGTSLKMGFFSSVAVAQPTSYTTDAYTTGRAFPTTLPPTLSTNSTNVSPWGFPTDAAFVNQVNRLNTLTSKVATLTGVVGTIYKDLVAYGLLK